MISAKGIFRKASILASLSLFVLTSVPGKSWAQTVIPFDKANPQAAPERAPVHAPKIQPLQTMPQGTPPPAAPMKIITDKAPDMPTKGPGGVRALPGVSEVEIYKGHGRYGEGPDFDKKTGKVIPKLSPPAVPSEFLPPLPSGGMTKAEVSEHSLGPENIQKKNIETINYGDTPTGDPAPGTSGIGKAMGGPGASANSLALKAMQEMNKQAQEEQQAAKESTQSKFNEKIEKLREKKENTAEQHEEERDQAWSNVGASAASAAVSISASATGGSKTTEDDDTSPSDDD